MATRISAIRPEEFSLDLRYTQHEGVIYLSGIHALVRLPLDQHLADLRRGLKTATLVSGYPGSPLGGLDLELHRQEKLLKEHEVRFIPGVNEDLAATAMLGSQMLHLFPAPRYDGVLGMWYGKGPGVDRTGDAFRHGNLFGVGKNGGVLALAGDDPTAKSSTIPSDSTIALYGAAMPILYPGDVQDILDLGQHGFMLSRISGLWVAMRIVTNVADGAGTAEVSPERINPIIPTLELDGRPFAPEIDVKSMGTPPILEIERRQHVARLELARRYAWENKLNRIVVPARDAWLGILAAGKAYYDVRQALDEMGLDDKTLEHYGVRLLKVGLTFPLEPRIVREFAQGLLEVLVVEEKRPFLEMQLKDILYALTSRPAVVGKLDEEGQPLIPINGELDADIIARAIARRLERKVRIAAVEARISRLEGIKNRPARPAPLRLPHFCSGCPHNRSLAVPEGSIVGAGIGCHSLTVFMDSSLVGKNIGMTQMGAEGAQWAGLAPFTDTPHIFQNMGDGTFFHSGVLAIRYAISAGANMTYKILYNHVVAMTGGQNPSGSLPVPDLTRLLEAEGVKKIIVTTDDLPRYKGARLAKIAEVWHRDRLVEAQTVLAGIAGVTVLIHDQQCALEKRRLRRHGLQPQPSARVFINERLCEGCGDCAKKSNCLSMHPVETELGRKVRVHQSSCTMDYSCLLGDCPAFVKVEPSAERRKKDLPRGPQEADLPEPERQVLAGGFNLYMMGVGGTGVVTVNQVLGTAALLDGKRVRGLDQTGLAQKGGPVVSHLKVSAEEVEVSNNVSAGEADLYLAFDLLVASQPNNLAKADPQRTIAVISTSQVPTGQMVVNKALHFPDVDSRLGEIGRVVRQDVGFALDAQALAEALFGDNLASNVILLGAAYQLGALPTSVSSIEQAIRLNGVAVEMNLAAFRWGRLAVANPDRLEEVLHNTAGEAGEQLPLSVEAQQLVAAVGATGELRRLLMARVPELIDFQDLAYARQYTEFVKKVKQREEEKARGSTAIAEGVARFLFKLMAYKDEYEVARLHLGSAFLATVRTGFGDQSKLEWQLNPPLLKFRGPGKKIGLGSRFTPILKALRALKRLRGTPFDLFGYAKVRRVERELAREYRQTMEAGLARLTAENYNTIAALAALPEEVCGYGPIKLACVEQYRKKAADLLAELG